MQRALCRGTLFPVRSHKQLSLGKEFSGIDHRVPLRTRHDGEEAACAGAAMDHAPVGRITGGGYHSDRHKWEVSTVATYTRGCFASWNCVTTSRPSILVFKVRRTVSTAFHRTSSSSVRSSTALHPASESMQIWSALSPNIFRVLSDPETSFQVVSSVSIALRIAQGTALH